jgi:hypothetical protein
MCKGGPTPRYLYIHGLGVLHRRLPLLLLLPAPGLDSAPVLACTPSLTAPLPACLPPPPSGGPWRPALVPLVSASRVTSPGSPQDTRHLVLDTSATPALGAYQPGDLLCIFPRTPAAAVQVRTEHIGHYFVGLMLLLSLHCS